MEITRGLIRRKARRLRLLTVPVSSIQADMLIGAGCVAEIETSGVSMGEFRYAPIFGVPWRTAISLSAMQPAPRCTPNSRRPKRARPSCR